MKPFLIFDAYGTLLELDDFYGRLAHGFAQHNVMLPPAVVRHAAHCEMKHYMANTRHVCDEASWLALRSDCARVLADAVREQNHDLPLSPDTVLQILSDSIVFHTFPETRSTLEELQRREVPMAVLSNWDYQLPCVLQSVRLNTFFEFVMTSAQAGVEKPDPVFFEQALQRARAIQPGLTTRDCFYIGDHYEKDVVPARNAGLTPLWIVRNRRDIASGDIHEAEDAVQRLSSLHDLLQVLDRGSA